VISLPVSGVVLSVREPTGHDELFVVEQALTPLSTVLELARRVGSAATGDPLDWAGLPATDLYAAALVMRQSWLGDIIRTDTTCPGPGCLEPIDVSFGIANYLEHHRPRGSRRITQDPGDGWFSLDGAAVRFRIPTIADLLDAASESVPADTLVDRCIDTPEMSSALARRLDRALARLAPRLDDVIGGSCPACERQVAMRFDPLTYILAELQNAFSGIYRETHALAAAYGWPEQEILALPRSRRRCYASIIADERSIA
jgi:hypothetical protein